MSKPTRRELADAIRLLSVDAVQKANSGHPGMPMGMADIAEVLWSDFLRHNPNNPSWLNRDRFVLSNGHGSMLQYALLHLTGYDLTIEDLKKFRQLHSKTPGHPEYGYTPGVETTTGPLGQGLANAVGFAIAQKHLAAIFNKENFPIIDNYIYCFAGDGDLMEGISHEACSLAGTLGLNKLIVFYDDNGISIDGEVTGWFTDNTPLRFQAYNWHVIPNIDGHDSEAIRHAILEAQNERDRPTIICCKTTIGWGAPNVAGTASTHGAALGEKEVAAVRENLNWNHLPFVLPEEIYAAWNARQKGQHLEKAWHQMFAEYQKKYPREAMELLRRTHANFTEDWQSTFDHLIQELQTSKPNIATRKASQLCLEHYTKALPELFGGSADLTESNCTNWKDMQVFTKTSPQGRYIHYGVREFGMSAIMNGIALYGGMIPFGGTFLTFSDYARNALRLASIMQIRVIYVYSHDSIGLGEDGPTHQPVEQLPSLRMMPNLNVWRPSDAIETSVAWKLAIERKGPTCLLFSRQNLAFQARSETQIKQIACGAYTLVDHAENKTPDAILIATGSEVGLAVEAANELKAQNISVRVVSMPSTETFLSQSEEYIESVLPANVVARVAIEAAASAYWYQFVGSRGKIIGLDHYGASAPAKDVFADCGFSVAAIVAATKDVINNASDASQPSQPKKVSLLK